MHLWQMDLAGGRECKMVTGIDDHSRFVVITQVVAIPSGRAVCAAFTTAKHVLRPHIDRNDIVVRPSRVQRLLYSGYHSPRCPAVQRDR